MSKPERQRTELINTAWKTEDAIDKVERAKKSLMELLREAKEAPHKETCNGQWLEAATEVLQLNAVDVSQFAADIRDLLTHGRGKGRNIMICGESNCAKSFMPMPLIEIYSTFLCPSNNKFNWVGANAKEVVLLNDFNYSEEDVMK